jgi:hypothetical protein
MHSNNGYTFALFSNSPFSVAPFSLARTILFAICHTIVSTVTVI